MPAGGYGIALVTNTGMISGDDAVVITDGLIDIIEGRPDAGAVPFTMTADLWLGGLTLLNLGLGFLGSAVPAAGPAAVRTAPCGARSYGWPPTRCRSRSSPASPI
ncbi:hypothetical protein ACSDR0_45820 [Streptosporangium sp. G11]|uniref:hypothetical protein n=1 Tax=Streptosporangium sp. G11 TaxID=3436926 RepID=UPI003EBABC97